MSKTEIITSKDGSHTLFVPELNEHYHSTNGAVQESIHVFIEAGLHQISCRKINILEFGFGTGLNAFLTAIHKKDHEIHYHSLEKYPLDQKLLSQLNYGNFFEGKHKELFEQLHLSKWEKENRIEDNFYLNKQKVDFKKVILQQQYHLIYFDAFAPEIQPKLWTKEIFKKAYQALLPGGILTTYCAKGIVRRTMQDIGFNVERLAGPPGKREMIRATKPQ
ncbi:tRNA (5-methylaminomethyl-2-thiouridine)(34)-methyltransferase MnmD [Saccharicrinis fermentans]|uniref:tRNA 5-methylaminomethyl-2-thiouridine biosynthesis bifunctional protein MnmC n=1 Tax=Saccharicrinis fermentans DSM 9555 = JCM 21142 TaxID=869213 RepID=W7Y0G4_9BACT|nr:tRNA (5-methylaminomethyl-2-thiouridine)(34)-methyltransferase MnmD [Saccharicrinis fermentans]GAF01437.1 tRNA 5-methylaminomethyl-2-thiouridine biosynthesis bifunctional protein MnmC [Saccharicrinis fermentans DSM 9555 = JCM 21142]